MNIFTKKVINESSAELLQAYRDGLISHSEIKDLLLTTIKDEEYEVAIAIREVLKILNVETNSE